MTPPRDNGDTAGAATTYTYWDNGWPATSTDPRGVVTGWDYNPAAQQSYRAITSGDGGMTRTMNWAYYPDGKLAVYPGASS